EKLEHQFQQAMQVGVERRNKFCENIISVPLPLAFT
ncbi:nitrogen regulation protein NIFR3, partial [Staphylococcus aureus subsp. aureus ST 1413]